MKGRRLANHLFVALLAGSTQIATAYAADQSPAGEAKNNDQSKTSQNNTGGPDFGPYMADLQRRIKRAWFPPKGNESKIVKVRFEIDQNGNASQAVIERSSGVAIADAAALKAVVNASPFKPLPPGASKTVTISFTFDFNTFNGRPQNSSY
jgi:TonB family protein